MLDGYPGSRWTSTACRCMLHCTRISSQAQHKVYSPIAAPWHAPKGDTTAGVLIHPPCITADGSSALLQALQTSSREWNP